MGYLTNYAPLGFNLVRDVFIETGTYAATTLRAAARAGYKTLHSIELNEVMYRQAVAALPDIAGGADVHVYFGSSPVILPLIMDGSKPTLFWLDAHWCGGAPTEKPCSWDKAYGQCPLAAELQAIMAVKWQTPPYILIDDAQMFTRTRFPGSFDEKQWPTVSQIMDQLTHFEYGFVFGLYMDTIYCLPGHCLGTPL